MAIAPQPTRSRIIFVLPSLRGGGAERVMLTILRHLDRSKFSLSLAVFTTNEAVYLSDLPDDVELINLECNRVRSALLKIIHLLWNRRPHIVFSTLSHLNLAIAIVKHLLPNRTRYIARETSLVSYILQSYRYPQIWSFLYLWFYKKLDLVVCQSCAMQSDLVLNFKFPEPKSIVINNPIDFERIHLLATEPVAYYGVSEDSIKLIAAGRLSEEKGFDMLIEAVSLLDNKNITLTLLGEGPLSAQLLQLAEQKGIVNQINFVGFQSNPYAWFAKADAFILSSRYEGFPNAMLEAMACGTPVIATPAPGGTREILDGVDGCVIASDVSAGALADAIAQWIGGKRERLNPVVVEPYTLKHIVAAYEQVFSA